ncbi:hypothetical protein TI39_contig615g00011 [Zymoseptoria brevis]|uniref:Nudix hydrolase domain-containing protein n=1 Tax=Zymoseptoria brevis TaxID=1047168 RepID=A0A0F4GGN7_9PEZI|nr:hypothetical protein TI39_contig615g00011 [Zymoseptoria brevis]
MAQQQNGQSLHTHTSNGSSSSSSNGGRSMEARVGRDKQRYGPTGERLVAGVVPLSPTKTHVLLIQSSSKTSSSSPQKKRHWVLPKGGWESDEPTPSHAALREAWEEAGIECSITRDLGTIEETRSSTELRKDKKAGGEAPRARYFFFEVGVRVEREEWPEGWKRERRWMRYREALAALGGREELVEALERSGILKQ